jgi:hypothetical protein
MDDNARISVEFDLDSGEEQAVVWRKFGVNDRASSVVRARWQELTEAVDEHIDD